jgi:diguanylate cyclase (GGDEF)-like protein/PAS domain S-box-containing protein
MAKNNEAIRLLILEESQNAAESLVSLLRNAGRATRAHLITSEEDLLSKLKDQNWDMLLARPETPVMKAEQALKHIRRLNKDIPAILIDEDNNSMYVEAALKMGAQDVVVEEENNHILGVILRELANLEIRKELQQIKLQLMDSEKRCQLLLQSSKDAIAYVHDGMHIHANQAYVDAFGYEDIDDLAGLPVIDMVTREDIGKFKVFLKNYSSGDSQSEEFECGVLKHNGESFDAVMTFSAATYADEPCTQITIRTQADNAELEEKLKAVTSLDMLTGLYNKQHILEALSSSVEKALKASTYSTLIYINTDKFGKIKADIGIANADTLVAELASVLKTHFNDRAQIGRIGEDVFAVILPGADVDAVQADTEILRHTIEQHLFEIAGKTHQITISAGIAPINDSTPSHQEVLNWAHLAADHVRDFEETASGNGVQVYDASKLADSGEERLKGLAENALSNNAFKLLFQPIISLRGEEGEHYETLLRLTDLEGKDINAHEFMSGALPEALVRKIDRWVILAVIKQLSEHRKKGHDARLFVNLSGLSFSDEALLPWLSVALKASGVPPSSLIFQFHEAEANAYLKPAGAFTTALSKLGCKVSISRFGSSLNPFNILKHLSTDYIKIDGAFTKELSSGAAGLAELTAVVKEIHAQGKASVVPKVENASAMASLWQAGVCFIQGYYLQEPTDNMDYDFNDDE